VDRHRYLETVGGCEHAEMGMRRLHLADASRHGLAESETLRHTLDDRRIQKLAGFLSHPEPAGPKRLVDILRRAACNRQLEVVDDPRAICRKRGNEAALHQIDQNRSKTRLDDMGAEAPDDSPIAIARRTDRGHNGDEIGGGKHSRQRRQERRDATATIRSCTISGIRLALSRPERIGVNAGQIELFVGEFHGQSIS